MENICQVISFSKTKEILTELNFFGSEPIPDGFLNERHILSIAKKLQKNVMFQPIPDWEAFESGMIDILPGQLIDICFSGLEYQNEKLLIITMESYTTDKVFLVDFVHYEEFANSYDLYLGENMDFVQPMDYIFLLLNQKNVVYVNHEGVFTQIKFG